MSRIEQLIAEICPDGVEYKKLGEITVIKRGERVTKADIVPSGKYPIISGGTKPLGNYDKYNRDPDTITIAQYGTAGFVDWQYDYFWANDVCYSVYPFDILNNRYLYFTLLKLQDFLYSIRTNAVPAHLPIDKLKSIEIPIPPLPIQHEIVRILDTFTDLDAELQAELEARKKQYEHYRNQLLNFEGKEVDWKTLGEIANVTKLAGFEFTAHIKYADKGSIIALRGINVKNGSLDLSNVKYIDDSNFSKLTRSKLFMNDMLFTYVGTIGDVALIDKNDRYYLAPNVSRIRFLTDKVIPRLMMYYFQTFSFKEKQIEKYLAYSSLKNLSMENIRKFKIPIPPLSEQERIVRILDKFNKLVNEELPAEIDARRKQYEYYREKLLAFEPLVS